MFNFAYSEIGVVLVFRDITVQKRMQDSILKSEKQLRNLSSSILGAQGRGTSICAEFPLSSRKLVT
jgi:hypothetical protein